MTMKRKRLLKNYWKTKQWVKTNFIYSLTKKYSFSYAWKKYNVLFEVNKKYLMIEIFFLINFLNLQLVSL